MKKYLCFSFDDGTLYDKDVIALLNKYNLKATFNLNSGLANYVWYYNDKIAIHRLDLLYSYQIYDGHEVSSHTLTHPDLTLLNKEEIIHEVNADIRFLRWIFKDDKISSFAIPFDRFTKDIVNIIKENTFANNIRLPIIDESFKVPSDRYHLKITALDINRAIPLFFEFLNNKDDVSVFIYAGHSYDFYVNNTFSKFETFLNLLKSHNEVEVLTIKELVEKLKL